ncbi:MAG: formylglycine-generating enzyme family protein [Polyangiaceae bacterium]
MRALPLGPPLHARHVCALVLLLVGCKHSAPPGGDASSDAAIASTADLDASVDAGAPAPPRPGMIWIPAGTFKAGTPVDKIPRIADEELPGTDVAMQGFYIDMLPYPDEIGGIPTTNVSRADAAKLCEAKQKRLCSELEWERACKGPDSTTYEYGDAYEKATCATGVSVEQAAKRPSGQRVTCKSAFGVQEMHGGAWEWTDSPWARGTKGDLGVLRGGNAKAGELVGRCANAIARKPKTSSATMGFRCCAGDRNAAEVNLTVDKLPVFTRIAKPDEVAQPIAEDATKKWTSADSPQGAAFVAKAAWRWHPIPNEELAVISGCVAGAKKPTCGTVVARGGTILQAIDGGRLAPEVALFGESRKIRMQSVDDRSAFVREITYVVGMLQVAAPKR